MQVRRIVPNLKAEDPGALTRFYQRVFGLEVQSDMGWISFLRAPAEGPERLQIASHGGSGTELPALSIEVDDLAEAQARAEAEGAPPVYGPADEPWGVRRFYLRDPAGNLVNVVTHAETADG